MPSSSSSFLSMPVLQMSTVATTLQHIEDEEDVGCQGHFGSTEPTGKLVSGHAAL